MKKLLLVITLAALSNLVIAQVDNSDLALADESIDAPSLNIDGQYKEKEVVLKAAPKKTVQNIAPQIVQKPLTPSEKIRLYREKLEVRNQIMVQKKMEQIRLQQEIALARKLEQAMNQTIKAIDANLN